MMAIAGNPKGPKTMEECPAYIRMLHSIDRQRQNRIRVRVKQIVEDSSVAEKLQACYPTWCKRPCFHEDYLPTFNRDNVTLVDTGGKGVDQLTADSIVVGGQSFPVDIIIFATGFRAPFDGTPAEKANLTITSRDGISMTDEWAREGPSTLHGVLDHNFPNLFLSGPWQAAVSPSYSFNEDALAKHAAYIWAEAKEKAGGKPFAVRPTAAAVEDWGTQILMHAAPLAAAAGCMPNYLNIDGELDRVPPEARMKLARSGIWVYGIEDFVEHLEKWRAEGGVQDIEVQM